MAEKMPPVRALKLVSAPIHPEGRIFVASAAVLTAVLFWLWVPMGWLGTVVTVFCAYFFRDPDRMSPSGEALVLSPVDGKVLAVGPADPPAELDLEPRKWVRISIFLNIFNVHVNRFPVDGVVRRIRYHPGKFFNAALDKASDDNERNAVHLSSIGGEDVVVVQIAGLIARRIVCDAREGQEVVAGERLGIIRFGSRADVYLPSSSNLRVIPGQTMIGGETVLGEFMVTPTVLTKTLGR